MYTYLYIYNLSNTYQLAKFIGITFSIYNFKLKRGGANTYPSLFVCL